MSRVWLTFYPLKYYVKKKHFRARETVTPAPKLISVSGCGECISQEEDRILFISRLFALRLLYLSPFLPPCPWIVPLFLTTFTFFYFSPGHLSGGPSCLSFFLSSSILCSYPPSFQIQALSLRDTLTVQD